MKFTCMYAAAAFLLAANIGYADIQIKETVLGAFSATAEQSVQSGDAACEAWKKATATIPDAAPIYLSCGAKTTNKVVQQYYYVGDSDCTHDDGSCTHPGSGFRFRTKGFINSSDAVARLAYDGAVDFQEDSIAGQGNTNPELAFKSYVAACNAFKANAAQQLGAKLLLAVCSDGTTYPLKHPTGRIRDIGSPPPTYLWSSTGVIYFKK